MVTKEINNYRILKTFIKSSFILIGLFYILSCCVAVFLLQPNKNIEIKKNNEISNNINDIDKKFDVNKKVKTREKLESEVLALILKLIGIPTLVFIIVFFSSFCLLKKYFSCLSNNKKGRYLIEICKNDGKKETYNVGVKAEN